MKVLIVVSRRYNGHELWTALGVLQQRGHQFEVISTDKHIQDEKTGKRNVIARTLDDVKSLNEFDALMFISGNMKDTEAYWDDPRTQSYVLEARSRGMPLAAICCSVPTVREAVKDKRVSFFPLVRSKARLLNAGAILQTVAVSVDGNLVTAEHQMATQMWVEEFCNVLEGKPQSLVLHDSGYTPPGRLAKPDPDLQYLRDVVKSTGKLGFKEDDISSK